MSNSHRARLRNNGRFDCDWRWLHGRRDSPWYPQAMRLFRQPAPRAWGAVIDEAAVALQDWALARKRPVRRPAD